MAGTSPAMTERDGGSFLDPDLRLPSFVPGMRIGLLGGSFDPPHAGHVAISDVARRVLDLDRIWWLVSPGNPLKPHAPGELTERIAAARALTTRHCIAVTGIEAAFRHRSKVYTADTLARLLPRLKGTRPVWIMGADNLATFHRWRDWQDIAAMLPIAILNRPGWALKALASPAAQALRRWRIDGTDAPLLASLAPPAWIYLPYPSVGLSSSAIREANRASVS